MFFSSISDVQAVINSEYQIEASANRVMELANADLLSMVYKNELVGYRLDAFKMRAQEYQRLAQYHAENLNALVNKVQLANNSIDVSDSEKEMQRRQYYQEADAALSDLNSKTITYLYGIKDIMPTITYERYVKKFLDFYNGLQLSDSELRIR